MTGIRIAITPEGIDETLAYLREAAARADNPRGMYEAIGGALVDSTRARFKTSRAPDGSVWPPSIRALAEGGRTLIDSTALVNDISHEATDTGVAVGSALIYAAVHQFGGTIRPVRAKKLRFKLLGEDVFADEVTIPARPFLGLDEDDEAEIRAVAGDWLLGEQNEARPS